jgi:hypothetical protein
MEISGYYQIPEDQQPVGTTLVEEELVDFSTGSVLIDAEDSLPLLADTFQSVITSDGAISINLANSEPIAVNVVNQGSSEVEYSLLGVQRSETALSQLSAVNTYGFDFSLWTVKPGGTGLYKYSSDPYAWNFQVKDGVQYGWFARHLPQEAALQVYALPPEKSFPYPFDDGSRRYPGGNTDGVIENYIETTRAFRYQPGRITGVTMGVRMSTGSGQEGESIQWGCRNAYGDGYYFRLDRGTDLYIVRTSPDLPTLEVERSQWNGDPILADRGTTGWALDLSKVTMYKIEFGWYGAIGAQFMAYVPIGHDDGRWVKLHSIRAENSNTVPSLRNPFLRLFIQARQVAGAVSPAFINLYGSSIYIDGGDDGTLEPASAFSDDVLITNQARSILGIEPAARINGVDNQKTIVPSTLAITSTCDAKIDLVNVIAGIGNSESYNFGHGSTLSGLSTSNIAVVRNPIDPKVISGVFPSGTLFTSATRPGTLLSGYPVKVNIAGVNAVFAEAYSSSSITVSRNLPSTTTGITLSSFNNYALASGITIVSGDGIAYGSERQYTGKLFFRRPTNEAGGNYWRIGLALRYSGAYNPNSSTVFWLTSSYPAVNYTVSGIENGEVSLPNETYRQVGFAIIESGGNAEFRTYPFRADRPSGIARVYSGSPFPIGIVAELYPDALLSDVVLSTCPTPNSILALNGEDFSDVYDDAIVVPGSGRTVAVTNWITSGVAVSTVGFSDYVANKFEQSRARLNPGTLVDTQGRRSLYGGSTIASFFLASGESSVIPLSPYFSPDRLFLTGAAGSQYNNGALFVVGTARQTGASGILNACVGWSEQ